MAAYPSLVQIYGGTVDEDEGTIMQRAVSGKPRLRSYFTETRRTFKVKHDLNEADKDALIAFYDTNKDISFSFVYSGDATTYTCLFASRPKVTPTEGFRFAVDAVMVTA